MTRNSKVLKYLGISFFASLAAGLAIAGLLNDHLFRASAAEIDRFVSAAEDKLVTMG